MMKKTSILMVLLMMITLIPVQAFASDYDLYVDGNKTEGMVMEHSGIKMIPLKYLANGLNLDVMWNQKDLAASTMFDGQKVTFKAGYDMAMLGESTIKLDKAPEIIHGRIYISEMTVNDIMGLSVQYDGMMAQINLPKDIIDTAVAAGSFKTLAAALQAADLVGALKGEGPFTVFAPTNAAFEQLLMDLNITAEELLAQPDLAKVLTYHVVPGKVMSNDLVDKMEADTVNGQKIMVDLSDGVVINFSNVTTADLEATNGVIHVIDKVLVPDDFKLQ